MHYAHIDVHSTELTLIKDVLNKMITVL